VLEATRKFQVTAIWDAEADVFYSASDIPGLHLEAATFDEFVELVRALAPEMITDNLPGLTGRYSVSVTAERSLELSA
jgi:hypothetical protein